MRASWSAPHEVTGVSGQGQMHGQEVRLSEQLVGARFFVVVPAELAEGGEQPDCAVAGGQHEAVNVGAVGIAPHRIEIEVRQDVGER
jgi:hypothetical protein